MFTNAFMFYFTCNQVCKRNKNDSGVKNLVEIYTDSLDGNLLTTDNCPRWFRSPWTRQTEIISRTVSCKLKVLILWWNWSTIMARRILGIICAWNCKYMTTDFDVLLMPDRLVKMLCLKRAGCCRSPLYGSMLTTELQRLNRSSVMLPSLTTSQCRTRYLSIQTQQ